MACTNCSGTSSFSIPNVQSVIPCANGIFDSRCGVYTGPYLSCINVQPNTCLQDVIQSINAAVCQSVGDYTQYNFNCLAASYTITNEGEFVDAITDYTCNTRTDLTSLEQTVQDNFTNLSDQITDITNPGLISNCPTQVIYDANSTLNQIITAQTTAICNVYTQLSLTGVDWDKCYTPVTTPLNIIDGFNEVLTQICLTKDAISTGGALPTFDNTGTCLSSPTTTDSLVDTVVKIRTRLCLTPTFSASNLAVSSCVQFSGASTLEDVIDAQNSQIDQVSTTSIRGASAQFVLADIDPLQPCLGKTISLAASVVDRNVAATPADVTPGTLQDKLVAGTNFSLDYATTPGKVILNASGAALSDEKVKANATDPTAGYLDSKVVGDNTDPIIQTTVTPNATNVQIGASINLNALINAIFDEIEADPTLQARFCAIVSSCPVICTPPTNASVTFQIVP